MLMHIIALIYRFYNLMISNVAKNHRISSFHGSQFVTQQKHNWSNSIATWIRILLEIARKPHIKLCRWKISEQNSRVVHGILLVCWLVVCTVFSSVSKERKKKPPQNDSPIKWFKRTENSCGFLFLFLQIAILFGVESLTPFSQRDFNRANSQKVLRFVSFLFYYRAHETNAITGKWTTRISMERRKNSPIKCIGRYTRR